MTTEITTIEQKTTDEASFESQQLRFSQGVLFRGKFFGVEDVKKETGDDVCQDSMVKLKAVLASKKESKQRICIKINLDGIELVDEKTNTTLFKHSVNRISYIARDIKDARAIGYIYKNSENSFQYFGLRTLDQAQIVFNTLKELFEVVLKIRTLKKKEAETSSTEKTPVNIPTDTNTTISEKTIDNSENKTVVETNEKASLLNNEEPAPSEKPANIFDLIDTPTTQSIAQPVAESKKPEDPFGLLDLANPVPSPANPPITSPLGNLSLSNDIFVNANTQPRPAPTPISNNNLFNMNTNPNPLMTNPMLVNQMSQPQPGFMSQPFFQQQQQPGAFPTANSSINPFSTPFNSIPNGMQPQRPSMSPTSTAGAFQPGIMNPSQNQPNFNDLFSMQANKTPTPNNLNKSNTNSNAFNW